MDEKLMLGVKNGSREREAYIVVTYKEEQTSCLWRIKGFTPY